MSNYDDIQSQKRQQQQARMRPSNIEDEYQVSLNDRERAVVLAQVDHFVEIMTRRYGLEPLDVIETVRWVKERKVATERLKMSGAFALIGIIVSALLLSVWEGVLSFLHKGS